MAGEQTKRKKNKNTVLNILLVIFIGIFIFAGARLGLIYYNYHQAESEYDSLEEEFVVDLGDVTDETAEGSTVSITHTEADYPAKAISFDALQRLNEEIIAWLYLPACDISYPVVQGSDNDYYLNRTFKGQYNGSGSIFMDYENSADFTDYNTIIYGHNMKNGSMFGKLKHLYQTDGLRDSSPYFYIYRPGGIVLKYEIFSYYITTADSTAYSFLPSESAYDTYVNSVARRSIEIEDVTEYTSEYAPIVTLSTCSGRAGGDQRFVVHGILIGTFEQPQ